MEIEDLEVEKNDLEIYNNLCYIVMAKIFTVWRVKVNESKSNVVHFRTPIDKEVTVSLNMGHNFRRLLEAIAISVYIFKLMNS